MALAKLQERGQFTVPASLRKAVGLKAGDTLLLRAVGPGRFEAIALQRRALSSFFLDGPPPREVSLAELREEMGQEIARECAHDIETDMAQQEVAATRDD